MKKKILFIDDGDQNFSRLLKLLEADGYEVAINNKVQDCLTVVNEIKPGIILLDVQNGEMDSFEICRRLKNNDNTKSISVIVFTSFAIPEDKKNAMESRADGFIEKPINPETFISQMESIVRSFNEMEDD